MAAEHMKNAQMAAERTTQVWTRPSGFPRRSFLAATAALTLAATSRGVQAAPPSGGPTTGATGGPTGMPAGTAEDASAPFRAVVERLRAAMAEHGVPGAAVGVLGGGREEHAVLGVASVESGAAVTPDTLFQIGSLTKPYTATAILRLSEAGTLDLDAPVRTVLPHLRLADESATAQVTVRHLLTHTGGWWGDYFSHSGDGDDAIERFVATDLPTLTQLAPVGAQFSYNNAGYILLGRLIEVVTGRRYRTALHDLVLDPLGLRQSSLAPAEVTRRAYAIGHTALGAPDSASGSAPVPVPVSPLFLPRNTDPAGGLWSTTREQIRFARFHLGQAVAGGRILRPETLQLMQTPQVSIPHQAQQGVGLGWFIIDRPDLRLVTHDGATFGQHTILFMAPARDFAFVLLTNAQAAGAAAAQSVLVEALMRYGLVSAPAAPGGGSSGASTGTTGVPGGAAGSPPPEVLAGYAGRYRLPSGTTVLRVSDGVLVADSEITLVPGQITPTGPGLPTGLPELPQGVPLTFVREDVAVVLVDGVPAGSFSFVRRPDGSVGWMQVGSRLVPRVGPVGAGAG